MKAVSPWQQHTCLYYRNKTHKCTNQNTHFTLHVHVYIFYQKQVITAACSKGIHKHTYTTRNTQTCPCHTERQIIFTQHVIVQLKINPCDIAHECTNIQNGNIRIFTFMSFCRMGHFWDTCHQKIPHLWNILFVLSSIACHCTCMNKLDQMVCGWRQVKTSEHKSMTVSGERHSLNMLTMQFGYLNP